jgi:lipopolysaccharide export system protein LptC
VLGKTQLRGLKGDAMTASADSVVVMGAPARGFGRGASSPPDRERLFAEAKRRSRRVRFLRKAILISVLSVVAGMIATAIFDPFGPKSVKLSFSGLSLDGTKIAMAKPRLAGFRSDGQSYVLTAERAVQDVKHPTVAELQKLVGDMGIGGPETMRLTADTGVYDSVAERMKLSGNVTIDNSRFEVRLRSVDIDFKTGVYRTEEPVEVHMSEGTTVAADRATAQNNGKELVFEGRVRTTVIPQSGGPAEDQTQSANP